MHVTLIDNNDRDLLLYEYILYTYLDKCEVTKYKCASKFIHDLNEWRTPISDLIITDYFKEKYNGESFLRNIHLFKYRNKILQEKLNVFIISSSFNFKKGNWHTKPNELKGFIRKPLNQSNIKLFTEYISEFA